MSQLKGNEFIDPKFFDELNKGATESLKLVKQLINELQSNLKSKEGVKLVEPKSIKDIEKFNKTVGETRKVIDNLTKAEAKELQLQKEISQLKNNPVYAKQQKEIERLRQEKNAINKATRDEIKAEREAGNEYKKQSRLLNDLINKYQDLAVAGKQNTKEAKALLAQITPLDKKLKDVDSTVGRNFRSVGNYEKGLGKLTAGIKGFLTIGVATNVIRGLSEINKEIRQGTRLARTFFDVSKEGARELTVQARGLAQAYDLELNETLETANVLSKQFGVSGTNALDLIEEGISKGANVTGEFLENLKEYSTQFRLAGLSADESIALITQQVKEGVFSDKGVDAIKEATLSLRELTPATVEALEAIGLSAEQIQKDIQSGSKTYFDVIQEISSKTKEFGEDSQQAGQILADVFKGAGEDAGDFIFKLGDVNLKLDEQASILSEADEAQIALDKSWNQFTTNVSNGENIIGKAFTKIKEALVFVLDEIERASLILELGFEGYKEKLIDDKAIQIGLDNAQESVEKFNIFLSKQLAKGGKTREQIAESFLRGTRQTLKATVEAENATFLERLKIAKKYNIDLDLLQGANLKGLRASAEERIRLVEEIANVEINSNSNVINSKKDLQKEEKEIIDLKKEQLSLNKEISNFEDEELDLFLKRNEEKKESEEDLAQTILDISLSDLQRQDDEIKVLRANEEEKKRIRKETYANLNKVADAFATRQQERSEQQIANIDKEIEASRSRVDSLRQFAIEGNLNASNSIAVEEKREAEATLKKEKEIKKQKAIESSLALLKTYTTSLENGKTTNQAITEVLKNGTLLAGLINALPSFDVGTDNTSKHIAGANGGVDGKGGFLAVNHPNEKIFNEADSTKIGFEVPNSVVADTFSMAKKGLLVPKDQTTVLVQNNWQSNDAILSKFDSLEKAIKQQEQRTVRFDFDNVTKTLTEIMESQNSTIRTKKRTGVW